MNPGDLVEICCGPGGLVSIGSDDGTAPRDFPTGILCIYLGVNREWTRGRFAYDILIDGAPGWVWQNESDFFIEMMGEDAAQDLKDGQDVTAVFADDIARPVKAVIIEAEGPGGGNPYVEFTFIDEDHSWEWASANMDMEPDDYEIGGEE